MRFTLSRVGGWAALWLTAFAGGTWAQTGSSGGKIEFSAPSNPIVASNLNRLDPRQNSFRQVEDDLFKPFKPRAPVRWDFPPPQPIAPMPDKRALEMLDRRRNWAFAEFDDFFPDMSTEKTSTDGLDGRDQKPVSLVEKYIENLNKRQLATTNRVNVGAWIMRNLSETNNDLSAESYTVEGQMMKFMREAVIPHSADTMDKSVVDFKHLNPNQINARIEEQKRRSEDFQQLLNPHAPPMPATPVNSSLAGQLAGNNPGDQFNSATPSHRTFAGPVDAAAKAFYSHVYDDPTALALGLTNNLLSRPPEPVSLVPAAPQPFDSLPKRKF